MTESLMGISGFIINNIYILALIRIVVEASVFVAAQHPKQASYCI